MSRSFLRLAVASLLLLPLATTSSDARDRSPSATRQAHHPARRTSRVQSPHATPLASRNAGTVFAPAPVPDQDVSAPVEPENRDPHVAAAVFRLANEYVGHGYPYGSSPKAMDDRKVAIIPGIKLSVPLP